MSGGKGKEEKVITKILQNEFKKIKDFIVYKNNNNIEIDNNYINDFSIVKYDFSIVNFLEEKITNTSYIFSYIRDILKFLFKNEISRDKYLNKKDFNSKEFESKLIYLNKKIELNFNVNCVIKHDLNGEMFYEDFLFENISFNEIFEEIFKENLKKLENLKKSFELVTGEYNSQFQTLKDKMFKDVEKLLEGLIENV